MRYLVLAGISLAIAGIMSGVLILAGDKPRNAVTMGLYVFGAVSCFGYAAFFFRGKCPNCHAVIEKGTKICPECQFGISEHNNSKRAESENDSKS